MAVDDNRHQHKYESFILYYLMPSTILSILHALSYLFLQITFDIGVKSHFIRKLKIRKGVSNTFRVTMLVKMLEGLTP